MKILVTGHSGFIGSCLIKIAQMKGFEIIGVSRSDSSSGKLIFEKQDLSQLSDYTFLDKYELDGIIHLAANSNVGSCEVNPEASFPINVTASVLLAEYAKSKEIPFVFASTDLVFDGVKGAYAVEDSPNPINEYGKQKRLAEVEIKKVNSKSKICRLPLILGESGGYMKSFIDNMKQGKEEILFTDEIRSPEKVEVISQKLLNAISWDGGVYHLGGPKTLNRYEMGLRIAKEFGLNINLLKKGRQADVKMNARRPKNVSLISTH